MTKSNPVSLIAGQAANYTISLKNNGTSTSDPLLKIVDLLPDNVSFNSSAPLNLGGGGQFSSASCNAAGQLLTCTATGPGIPSGGLAALTINVTPSIKAAGKSVVNRAYTDPYGQNITTPTGYPGLCTGKDTPVSGCAATSALTVQDAINLVLNKTNPTSLLAGQPASYGLTLSNQGTMAAGSSLVVYDQLPANLQYNSVAVVAGGSVTATAVSCKATGTAAAGQLLACTLSLPAGGLPPAGSTRFSISVTPQLASVGSALVNKAAIDPSGANAVQSPSQCTADAQPLSGCAVTPEMVPGQVGVSLSLTKLAPASLKAGLVGGYTLTLANTGINPSGPTLTFLDQLPPNLQFTGIVPTAGGSVLANSASCTPSGDLSTGLLLSCTVSVTGGLPAQSGSTAVLLNVTPSQAAVGQSVLNKASLDPAGAGQPVAPASCTATAVPSPGCAVSAPLTVASNPPLLSLSKTNPILLMTGAPANYSFVASNTGSGPSDQTLVVYDLLAANLQFNSATPMAGGSVTASGVSCALGTPPAGAPSGSMLLTCSVSLPAGGLPSGGSTLWSVNVTPLAGSLAANVINKAVLDPSGKNAVKNPVSCAATNQPAGCAVTPGLTVINPGPALALLKTNPPYLLNNMAATYTLSVTNRGSTATGTSLVVYDQLPANMTYNSAAVVAGGVTPTAVSCEVSSGTVATGQLMKCTLTLPAGGLPPGGAVSAGFTLTATPANTTTGVMMQNVAVIDSSGKNAVVSPYACQGTDSPLGCAMPDAQLVDGGTMQIVVKRIGGAVGPATFTFSSNPTFPTFVGMYSDVSVQASGDTVAAPLWTFAKAGNSSTGSSVSFRYTVPSTDWKLTAASCYDTNAADSGGPAASVSATGLGSPVSFGSIGFRKSKLVCTLTFTGPQAQLELSKSNPQALAVNLASSYTISALNRGKVATGNTVVLYDQMPPNLQFKGAVGQSGGAVVPISVSCSTSGALTTGQLLACTVNLPPGGLAPGADMALQISVVPQIQALASTVVNRVAVDITGNNAPASPASCTATGSPAGCALTPGQVVRGSSLGLSVISGMPGNFTFNGDNGWVSQTISLSEGSQLANGLPQALTDVVPTTLNLSPMAGSRYIANVSCTGMGSGRVSFTASSLSLDAAAVASGNAVSCTVRMGVGFSVSLNKISLGGTGAFTFTGDGGWASQTLTTTAAGKPVSGATQTFTRPGVTLHFNETAPAGWALTSVSCLDTNASQSGNSAATLQPLVTKGGFELNGDFLKPAAALVCTVTNSYGGFSISGMVLLDNGVGGGVAHDGLKNGSEIGQAGVTLSLSDCTGKVYSSALSDGSGQFSLSTAGVPAGKVCVQQSRNPAKFDVVSVQGGTAGASYDPSNEALSFNLAASSNYTGLLFGNVPLSTLTGEGSQQLQPGQAATYAHTFTAGTSATLTLVSSDKPGVSGQVWRSVVYQDQNCNAQLDETDSVIVPTQSLNVVAGQQICVLVRVISPDSALAGHTDSTQLIALATYQPTPTIGTRTWYSQRTDLSTISTSSAALVLLKQVRKVGNCPSTGADQQAFALSNQAAPGDFVEYLLSYSNGSSAPLTSILIQDAVPAYTKFRSAACGLPLPPGLQSCSVTQQPAVGSSTGGVQWTLKDASTQAAGLQPGGQGTVLYCVQVQR